MRDLEAVILRAKAAHRKGQFRKAANLLQEEILDICPYIPAKVYNLMGVQQRMLGNYMFAIQHFKAAAKGNPPQDQKSLAYTNMADYSCVGENNLEGAEHSIDLALGEAPPASYAHAAAMNQRGLIYLARDDFVRASYAFGIAIDMLEPLVKQDFLDLDIKGRYAHALRHWAESFLLFGPAKKEHEKAEKFAQEALEIFYKLGDRNMVAKTNMTLGKLAMEREEFEEANRYFVHAKQAADETNYKRTLARLSFDRAELSLRDDYPSHAKSYLEEFGEHVRRGRLEEHDLHMLRKRFSLVKGLYENYRKDDEILAVPGFEALFPSFENPQ
ncbi:MAG: hypothetical protein KJ709_05740 [Nanoarchaeota archaeon]|nr:hypothetical protein [Nanoarchaeota archaeon]